MTRTIKASEVKEGMTVQLQMEVDFVREHRDWPTFFRDDGRSVGLDGDIEVEVLSEHQPEEPTEFGAKVRVHGRRLVRLSGKPDVRFHVWTEEGTGDRWSWDDLCSLGPVTVIPDQGWTVPAEPTPVVPEKLYIWPICDEHLRGHKWRDGDGDTIQYVDGAWRYLWPYGPGCARTAPLERAPWTRVDVVPEEVKAGDWPEDDEHLRAYSWKDHNGNSWTWNEAEDEWDCEDPYGRLLSCLGIPSSGPWTRRDV